MIIDYLIIIQKKLKLKCLSRSIVDIPVELTGMVTCDMWISNFKFYENIFFLLIWRNSKSMGRRREWQYNVNNGTSIPSITIKIPIFEAEQGFYNFT